MVTKFSWSVPVLLLVACSQNFASEEPNERDLRIEVSTSRSHIKSCEPVELVVKVVNVGYFPYENLPAAIATPHHWLELTMISPSDNPVKYIGPEIQVVGINERIVLYPEHFYGTIIELDCESYDYSELGEYQIFVSYGKGPTLERNLKEIFESEALLLTVDEKIY